jgi:hypothetical protein
MGESIHSLVAWRPLVARWSLHGPDTQIHPLADGSALVKIFAMSLARQNDAAARLGYGGPRQAVIASALFGRSCRLL